MPTRIAVAAFVLAFASSWAPCAAQGYTPEERAEIAALKKRSEARYDRLLRLKDAGSVGETEDGLVAVTKSEYEDDRTDPGDKSSPTVGEVVADENADRKKLYAIIARVAKSDPAEVARQAMVGHFKRALPDHWVRVKGKWVRRKDLKLEEKPKEKGGQEKGEKGGQEKEKGEKKGESAGK